MKTFLAIILLTFLVSCGDDTSVTSVDVTPTEQTTSDISSAIEGLPESVDEIAGTELSVDSKVIELSTSYVNPKAEILLDINVTLDENDAISEISVTSGNFPDEKHVIAVNDKVQEAIGKTVEEASEYSAAGSSLASAAFQNALKNM